MNKIPNTFLIKKKAEIYIVRDKTLTKDIVDLSEKIEFHFVTREDSQRYETTYGDLFEIFKSADEKLSRSTNTQNF